MTRTRHDDVVHGVGRQRTASIEWASVHGVCRWSGKTGRQAYMHAWPGMSGRRIFLFVQAATASRTGDGTPPVHGDGSTGKIFVHRGGVTFFASSYFRRH